MGARVSLLLLGLLPLFLVTVIAGDLLPAVGWLGAGFTPGDAGAASLPIGSEMMGAVTTLPHAATAFLGALSPIGYRYLDGGVSTFCLLGTVGCGPMPELMSYGHTPASQFGFSAQTWLWIIVTGLWILGIRSLVRRRRTY